MVLYFAMTKCRQSRETVKMKTEEEILAEIRLEMARGRQTKFRINNLQIVCNQSQIVLNL